MTMSATGTARVSGVARVPLALWVGAGVYALLLVTGNRLLIDPDTLWQVTVGQWIIDHRAVPMTDVFSFTMRGQPWISTQWLAQVLYATAYDFAGWAGPVALAAAAIAATFALFARQLRRHLSDGVTLLLVSVALALMLPHLLARPHVLAMPVMVAWVGGLIRAADQADAPPLRLLPLLALWANLHGGFVLGLALIAPIALDAVWRAEAAGRASLGLRWTVFAAAALGMACVTPYGWNALLASQKILGLGEALNLIREWSPVDFGSLGPFEICLLASLGLALWRGVVLPPPRIALLLGLLYMALRAGRNQEVFALLAPLLLAQPLAQQFGQSTAAADPPRQHARYVGFALCTLAATLLVGSLERFSPDARNSPVAAVTELKTLHLQRVFNDYDFGGFLIANGVMTFIDGRTELFGEKLMVDHNSASGLMRPENLFRLLKDYDIEATLMRTQSAATKLLDHVDGWQKVYADDIATIHVRKSDALHSAEPAVGPLVP